MRTLARIFLSLFSVAAILGGAVFGLGGAEAAVDFIFGSGTSSSPPNHEPFLILLVESALFCVGITIGAVGTLFAFVLPVHFTFPHLTGAPGRIFGTTEYAILRWYARKLSRMADPR